MTNAVKKFATATIAALSVAATLALSAAPAEAKFGRKGAFFGGLAAAIRLACRGWRVQVLEKLDGPGGRAYVWKQDGFSFDAGPTIITAPFLLDELWATAGRKFSDDVELKLMELKL